MRNLTSICREMRGWHGPRMAVGLLLGVLLPLTAAATPTVLNFDDLRDPYVLTGSTYAGLRWEEGNAGLDGNLGLWAIGSVNYPHSSPENIVNGWGCTLIGIGFPSVVDMAGAYVGQQGNGSYPSTTGVRVHGYLAGVETGVTAWLTDIRTDPLWFDMSVLTNVDRIVVESIPVYRGGGWYGLDDLTFTPVPEPAGLAALGFLAAALLMRRRNSEVRKG